MSLVHYKKSEARTQYFTFLLTFQPFPVGPVRPPFIVVPSEGNDGGNDDETDEAEDTPAVDDEVLDDDVELVDPQNPEPVDTEDEANTRVVEDTTPATENFEPEVKLSDTLKQEIINQRVADFQALLG